MQLDKWVYLVPHSRSCSPFPSAHSGFFVALPSPGSLAQTGFILSYASVLHRVLPSSVRPRSEDHRRLPWGSRSLFATSAIRVLCPEPFSSARCLAAHDVSHVLDGFLRDWLCGFISPHCRVQGSLFRGLSPRPQPRCLSTTVALSSFVPTQLQAVAHLLHFAGARPQGFHLRPNPESH